MTRHPIKLHRWYGSRNATLRMKRDFIRELIGPIGPPRTRSRRCFSVHTAVCVSQSPIRLRVRASARVGGDTFPPAGGKEKNRRGQPLADRVDRRRAPPPPSSRRRTARGDGFLRSRESRRVISRFKARTRTPSRGFAALPWTRAGSSAAPSSSCSSCSPAFEGGGGGGGSAISDKKRPTDDG
eukprot:7048-Pelagococcus_subviridis.AAC.7